MIEEVQSTFCPQDVFTGALFPGVWFFTVTLKSNLFALELKFLVKSDCEICRQFLKSLSLF